MASTNEGHPETSGTVSTISTSDLASNSSPVPVAGSDLLEPGASSQPQGSTLPEQNLDQTEPTSGNGVEGETEAWDSHYSPKNFMARASTLMVCTVGWLALTFYAWDKGLDSLGRFAMVVGFFVGVFWLVLGVRLFQAYFGFHYRLTNRRLFHSTGILHRRRDMMELLRVKDVFTRQQSLMERWLGVGTVVVVPTEKTLPTFYLVGVEKPKEIMDLIWHHTRVERDARSVKVDQV